MLISWRVVSFGNGNDFCFGGEGVGSSIHVFFLGSILRSYSLYKRSIVVPQFLEGFFVFGRDLFGVFVFVLFHSD